MHLSAKVETLDFSMPSYGDYDSKSAQSKEEAPSFGNPFGDFKFGQDESSSSSDVEAPAIDKKAEERAAREAKKAEEEAAAAQKKAEKEARRQAELEKQKAAVERAKAVKEAKEAPVAEQAEVGKRTIASHDFRRIVLP